MNINVASQAHGLVAWTGGATPAANPIDLRHHVSFGFTFQVTGDIGANTSFEFESAPASDADPCVPGAWSPVKEVFTCMAPWGAVPTENAKVTIPAGTKAGTICSGTLPCKPDAFIRVAPTAGETADVVIVAVLGGPR